MPGKQPRTFFEILVSEGLLAKKRARDIIKASSRSNKSPVEIALEQGDVSTRDVERLAGSLGLASPALSAAAVDWAAVGRITPQEATRIPVLPVAGGEGETRVATVDPFDTELARVLTAQLGQPVALVFGLPKQIRDLLAQGPPAVGGPGSAASGSSFGDFLSDESQHRVLEELRSFVKNDAEWRRPILLLGVGCVGKTHLLRAVYQELGKHHPNRMVLFVAARDIKGTADGFPSGRQGDGLVVDDLESLAGDARLEEAFMQAFNTVFQQGGPIVVSTGRPLASVDTLSMRVRAALGICRLLTLSAPKQDTIETIARRAAARSGLDSGGINLRVLVQEAGGDLRRVLEAIESGSASRASGHQEAAGFPPSESVAPVHEPTAHKAADLLREEAEAIIGEAQAAIEEIQQRRGPSDVTLLATAREALTRAIQARDAGDFVASEQLGMEALERAALAHGRADSAESVRSAPTPSAPPVQAVLKPYEEPEGTDSQVKTSLRDADKAVREACDAGAEEYASRELRMAVNGLEEARRLAADSANRARAIEEARLAAEQARDAARRAKTRKEEARIKQEKEKVRRCQMAIEEVRKEHERLAVHEGDTPISTQLEEVEVFIDTAVQYQEVGSIGQALEQVMKARKRLNEIAEEARLRRELRDTINEVDGLVRDADKRGETQNPQQLVDIQNALAEAERVLMV
ncbi:MAG: DnaA/Hda family protein, partial [Candidatus Eisenbacteria bacterium]|nr:DnaA/Hda family protein [Candidatus Eisenbacteria bacterium]